MIEKSAFIIAHFFPQSYYSTKQRPSGPRQALFISFKFFPYNIGRNKKAQQKNRRHCLPLSGGQRRRLGWDFVWFWGWNSEDYSTVRIEYHKNNIFAKRINYYISPHRSISFTTHSHNSICALIILNNRQSNTVFCYNISFIIENYMTLDYVLQQVCFQFLYELAFLMALPASCGTRLRYEFGYIVGTPALFPIFYAE